MFEKSVNHFDIIEVVKRFLKEISSILIKQNLKLSKAERDDADNGRKFEVINKGHFRGGLWAVGFHSGGDKYKIKYPLDAELVGRLPDAFFNSHVVTSDMVCAKNVNHFRQI